MRSIIDFRIGDEIGRLTIVGEAVSRNGRHFPCKCSCASSRVYLVQAAALLRSLENGENRGCPDCYHRQHGCGSSRNPKYSKYQAMKQRCYNTNNKSYPNYGGRGIEVCERWRDSFVAFMEDMGEPPTSRHSIDRIETDGNYEPGNCRWATKQEQAENTRACLAVTIDGVEYPTMAAAARAHGVPLSTAKMRRKYGWSKERCVTEPVDTKKRKKS